MTVRGSYGPLIGEMFLRTTNVIGSGGECPRARPEIHHECYWCCDSADMAQAEPVVGVDAAVLLAAPIGSLDLFFAEQQTPGQWASFRMFS